MGPRDHLTQSESNPVLLPYHYAHCLFADSDFATALVKGSTTMEFSKASKQGWHGRFYEDFEIGDVYQHPLGRTVTTTDNLWFTLLTQNTAPIHFDHHYAAQTEFGKPLVDSTFTLALVTGQSVTDISQNVLANLGWDEVRLPNPVFEGDTIYSQSEVLDMRESKSRPNVGIVTVKTTGYNQQGKIVITFKRTVMVYKRGYAPQIVRLQPGESQ
jgi:itaconyl-CoA hydratase